MADITARGMAARAMTSGGGGGGGTTVDAYNKQETDNLLRGKANASDVYTSQQTDDLLDDKVDKVSGKGLSTNDYTNEDMSLVKTISNKANTNDVNASITNLQNQISETSENVDTINTELMTNAGYSLGMSINPTTFELTMTLKNSTGGTVSSQRVDLPIESMVVSASYANGKLSLKLQNGQTLDTDISAIVAGLVNQNFTIAGIDMKDNIEANELKTALGINEITSDVTTLKNDMSTAKTNISAIQSDISGLKTRDSELQSDIDENTTAIEQNKSDILSVANNVTTTNAKAGTSTTNTLSSVGWHRIFVAERQQFARSGILMINRAFGSREPESHTILFNITQGRAVLELLNKNVEKQSISKLRLVHANSSPQSKACFIDIYYNETGENKITSSVFCESIVATGAGSNFMNSRFVASNLSADIPEGYTSTELSLTNGDFLDRLEALETALTQTTTVSE